VHHTIVSLLVPMQVYQRISATQQMQYDRQHVLLSLSHVEEVEEAEGRQALVQHDDVVIVYYNQQVLIISQAHQMMKSVIEQDQYGVVIPVKSSVSPIQEPIPSWISG
jgi:hypothetical protein